MDDLDLQLADLSPEQRELLELLLRQEQEQADSADSPQQPALPATAPLSFAQHRLWFIAQFQPDNPFYNMPFAMRLRGALDIAVLEHSLNEIVRRHDILRTTFAAIDGQPIQMIAPTLVVALPITDLQALPPSERDAEAERLLIAEARRPFDLAQGPLLRASLLRLTPTLHLLQITLHHIIADGWSTGVLLRELATLYTAFAMGRPSPLPPLSMQYAEFAVWQRERLQGSLLDRQLAYWRQQLHPPLPVLNLPTDRPRPTNQILHGTTYRFQLPPSLGTALSTLSQQAGATLFMTLLAAFQTLLYRYTGQADLIVGTPIANRTRDELEGMIGFFNNMLALRTQLAGDLSFREVLGRVREVTLGAYEHQELPFERLAEELQPTRQLTATPLFQVMFALQNAPMPTLELSGLTLEPIRIDSGAARFDLSLSLRDTPQGLTGSLRYPTDLFDATTIERLVGHFETLLTGIVADPDRRLAALPLLTMAEQQTFATWNAAEDNNSPNQCVQQLFEAQAAQTPDAVAVVFAAEHLTYDELNCRANRLAYHLQSLGVGPETRVGICIERSAALIVGLLAVLKAGGAYLLIDPTYPIAVQAAILADAQVAVLLTQHHLVAAPPHTSAAVVCINADWPVIAEHNAANPAGGAIADNIACVAYRSSAAASPTGIQIAHQALVNVLEAMRQQLGLTCEDRVLATPPLADAAASLELLLPLTSGARLIIACQEVIGDARKLAGYLATADVTVLQTMPAVLRSLIDSDPSSVTQRRIVCSGAPLARKLVDQVLTHDGSLWQRYGTAETTGCTAMWRAQPNVTTTIGRPIAGTGAYILDQHSNIAPIGVAGELYISGIGLARGYLHGPALTAERFIPHAFSHGVASGPDASVGARLYKTGDLARFRSDGSLEYLGRIDQHIDLDGFQINLAQIEAMLSLHPAVRESVVVVRGERQIVAYVTLVQGQLAQQPAQSRDLRTFLQTHLPDYMLPAVFIVLEALPRTLDGQIDEAALPAPESASRLSAESYVAPRTATEALLAQIFADILGLRQVGIYDSFFALGGDSLLGVQIIGRANAAGLGLAPKHLLQHQTIAELASVVGAAPAIQAEQGLVTGPVPLIRTWFFEQHFPDQHHWNVATLLEVQDALDPELVEQVVHHLLRHHDALRLRFVEEADGWRSFIVEPDGAAPFTYVDLSALPQPEQRTAIETTAAELQTSLHLSEGPLLRVALFKLGHEQPNRLLIIIHHLAADGFSLRIVVEDFSTAYQQLRRGAIVQLPPKTTSVKAWSERLIAYAESPELRAELPYWLAEPRSPLVPIPLDFPEGSSANIEASARIVRLTFSPAETQMLVQTVTQTYNADIRDVLLTTLVQTFAQWTGGRSLLVDLLNHGRETIFEDLDVSRTVGWLAYGMRVILDIGAAASAAEAIQAIKAQLRAIPNRGFGYDVLRYLCPDPAIAGPMRALPWAEVLFNYLGQFDQALTTSAAFRPAPEWAGPLHSPQCRRDRLFQVAGGIIGGQLQVSWMYSEHVHRHETVERLAHNFEEILRALISHAPSNRLDGSAAPASIGEPS